MGVTLRIREDSYELPDGIHIIGRGADADITINVKAISSTHCRFSVEGKIIWLEDLGSRNGTRINGVRLTEKRQLKDGDKITLGNIPCEIIYPAAAAAVPPIAGAAAPKRRSARKKNYTPMIAAGVLLVVAFFVWQAMKGNPALDQARLDLGKAVQVLEEIENLPADTVPQLETRLRRLEELLTAYQDIPVFPETAARRDQDIEHIENLLEKLPNEIKLRGIEAAFAGIRAGIASGRSESDTIKSLEHFIASYPGCGREAEARGLIGDLQTKIQKRLQAAYDRAAEESAELARDQSFSKAVQKLKDFQEAYPDFAGREKITERIDGFYQGARTAFKDIKAKGGQLAGEMKFKEAREAYAPALEKFGIFEYKQKAGEAIEAINAQEDSLHKADRQRLADLIAKASAHIASFRFIRAVKALEAGGAAFRFPRYRTDLDARLTVLRKIAVLKEAWIARSAFFETSQPSLAPYGLDGRLFRVTAENLSIMAEEGAVIPYPFDRLTPVMFHRMSAELVCGETAALWFALGLLMQEFTEAIPEGAPESLSNDYLAKGEAAFSKALSLDPQLKQKEQTIYAAMEQRRALQREERVRHLVAALGKAIENRNLTAAEGHYRKLKADRELEVWKSRGEILVTKLNALRAEAEQARARALVSRGAVKGTYKGTPCLAKTVYARHPRIFFRPEAWGGLTVADIKRRSFVRLAVMAGDSSDSVAPATGPGFALAWVKTGNAKYADRAVQWIKGTNGRSEVTGNTMNCAHAAMAYDWIYDYKGLSSADRKTIEDKLVALGRFQQNLAQGANAHIFHTRSYGSTTAVGTIGFVLEGHRPEARGFIDFAVNRYRKALLPARAHQAGAFQNGYSYGNHVLMDRVIEFLLAWESATGDPIFDEIKFKFNNFLEDYGYYLVYGLQPDDFYVAWGDFNRSSRGGITHELRRHADVLHAKTGNPVFAALGNYAGRRPEVDYAGSNLFMGNIYGWPKVSAPESLLHQLPASRLFSPGALGHVFLRSGFKSSDIFIAYKCGNYYGNHGHFDQGSFVVYCGGNLALDSGAYTSGFGGSHRMEYYRKAIAHNTLVFPDTAKKDEGGQRIFSNQDIRSMSEFLSSRECHTGSITAYEEEPSYVHVASDVTAAYPSNIVRAFQRQLVFVQKNYLVVYDRVVMADPKRTATWLLHSQEKPDIRGKTFTVKQGGGALQGISLLPAKGIVASVGGPGKEFWVGGRNYPTPSGTENLPGAWRIEVSAPPGAQAFAFLHLLAPRGKLPPHKLLTEGGGGVSLGGIRIVFAGDGKKVTVK